MIQGFADGETALIWSGPPKPGRLPFEMQATALRKLRLLNQARALSDLRVPPGNQAGRVEGRAGGAAFDPGQRPVADLLSFGGKEARPMSRSSTTTEAESAAQSRRRATSCWRSSCGRQLGSQPNRALAVARARPAAADQRDRARQARGHRRHGPAVNPLFRPDARFLSWPPGGSRSHGAPPRTRIRPRTDPSARRMISRLKPRPAN